MRRESSTRWRLDRRINLSILAQLMVLASLILGSWINLQRQLDLLQHDVARLLENQRDAQRRLELLTERSVSHEHRIRTIEKDRDG
jgi:hypothetical protein